MVEKADYEVYKRIRAVLERDPRVNMHASDVHVAARGHHITLEGEVGDIPAKRIAANLVRQLLGKEYRVDDQLRVRAAEIGDGALCDKIAKVLFNELMFRDCDIVVSSADKAEHLRNKGQQPGQGAVEIDVANGVATLTGQVISLTHRRMMEVLLWMFAGCQRVDNFLKVVPAEQDTDEELTDAVRLALEKDPAVDASQVKVEINNGVVELDGLLTNEEQINTVARDVWSVPDVWDVHNHINVGARV